MGKSVVPSVKPRSVAVEMASVEQFYRTLRTLIKTAGLVGCFYFIALAMAPFAGKETAVSFALNFLADVKFVLTLGLAGAAGTWAVAERMLRERKTQKLQDRVKELETRIDPNRSTSGLTRTGKTNPRDRRF
ncbi:hypothetical protein QWJ46_18255 [Rhizobium sp. CBN3]|uniref:hypothetical protein n=1 Tax=Rhizobium sp. CBN3 TaxID=3058045 RepID=UPI0026729502|nr:hypothetical protein [Rhizobium sp. CBN3]MDO3434620.1 hypothetical protein [Rhizobium sp. CBN3]